MAALLPGEQRWLIMLPALPAAGGALDASQVYIPLQDGSLTALDRETGLARWTVKVPTTVPPATAPGLLFVGVNDEVQALDPATGTVKWSVPMAGRARGAMLLQGNLLLVPAAPDQLVAIAIDTQKIAWRATTGAGDLLMDADARAVYVSTAESRLLAVRLADGQIAWQRALTGTLSEPAVSPDRILVGSTTNWLWALDPRSGDDKWVWQGRVFGGDVIGATVVDKTVYVASKDNIIRALSLGSGNQLWQKDVKTRPLLPPRAFFGTVVVFGLSPRVSTFLAKNGTPVSTWTPPPPSDAELEGPPLVDEHFRPFSVSMVVVMRDGRVGGVRPLAMTFPEPAAAPLTTLPGRPVPRERLPEEADPAHTPATTDPLPGPSSR